ncbi:MAG: DUF3052 domain-containing protein [Actinomycetota bacterium]|nr:DUF3052 domain-containing protein [Actinomycetota bacterium]
MPEKDYSSTPLTKKLGIKEGSSVTLVGAPRGFPSTLAPLPDGAKVGAARPRADVIVMFAKRPAELRSRVPHLAAKLTPAGGLWIAWPKKASSIQSDLSFETVQRLGLDAGLVDNKSCSIDADWQALRFVYRLKDR